VSVRLEFFQSVYLVSRGANMSFLERYPAAENNGVCKTVVNAIFKILPQVGFFKFVLQKILEKEWLWRIVDIGNEIVVGDLLDRFGGCRVLVHDAYPLHHFGQGHEHPLIELFLLQVICLPHPEYLAEDDKAQRKDGKEDYNDNSASAHNLRCIGKPDLLQLPKVIPATGFNKELNFRLISHHRASEFLCPRKLYCAANTKANPR
jgi:hypothetical protein